MTRYLFVMIAGLGLALMGPALAHSPLEQAKPADGATVTTPPDTLMLKFRDSVILTAVHLKRGGEDMPVDRETSGEAATSFSVPLPQLSPGEYAVDWRALSKNDGHVMKGRLTFTVAAH